ncbi:hypothetical protein NEOLEDRAFT_1184555 [Neolentinus lepideus HHB14362 ss-1]|uniref:Ricin B lectin domain-containing protein n=1 Tax=Neolentinus lepideus HHB14362 ss-1 TaxID=1314782 RepID=A0A165MB62_9AGAM|nr:hypothetical protein NEOLEDRAFT_1184555 [Neolentinus lepideus HHB14362 ss-1]
MSTIVTGRYTITNVQFSNLAYLPDPNKGSPIVANVPQNSADEKWNLSELGNGRYTIQNVGHANYANTGHQGTVGTQVAGWPDAQQFSIQETNVKGRYTIATTDSRLFWGFNDDQNQTPITLANNAADRRNWWIFAKA